MSKKINDHVIRFDSFEEAQYFVSNKYGSNAIEFGIQNQEKFSHLKMMSSFYAITFNFDFDNMVDDYDICIRDLLIDERINSLSFICAANKKKHDSLIKDTKCRLKYDNFHCCLILSDKTIRKIKGTVEIIAALIPKTQIDWFEFIENLYTQYKLD